MARQSRGRLRFGRMFSPRSRSAAASASAEAQAKRRKRRLKKWRERFRRFSLSAWHESAIVATVCNLFRASTATARAVRAATGSQMVGMGHGRQLRIEGLEDRQMLSAVPFTAGNLIIDRVGDGIEAASTNTAKQVSLVEYTTGGSLVAGSIVNMPTFATANQGGLTDQSNQTASGQLHLSADGRYITLTGYDANLGTIAPSGMAVSITNRSLARVDAAGNTVTSGRLTDAYSNGAIRGAVSTNGLSIWTAGNNSTRFVNAASPPATTSTSVSGLNSRDVNIFAGILFADTSSAVATYATALPVSSSTSTNLTFSDAGTYSDNGAFVFFDRDPITGATGLNGLDTLYIVNGQSGGTGTLRKYEWNGSLWQARGIATISGGLNGLTGSISGANVVLYATTAITSNNKLESFTDSSAFGSDLSGSFTELASAGSNYVFRGVAFAPVSANIFYVDDDWASLTNGKQISDADANTFGNQPAIIGENAFATIAAAMAAAPTGSTILLFSGTYNEAPTVDAGKTLKVVGSASLNGNDLTANGTLQVDGSLSGGTILASGGKIGGTGTINATVVRINSGSKLGPGDSPGALAVNGNVLFKSGSTYEVEINGAAAGSHDLLTVNNGNVTIESNVTLSPIIGYTPATGDSVNVLHHTGTGSILGSFSYSQTAGFRLSATATDETLLQNQAPVITSSATASVAENSTPVQSLTANDPDGDTVTFSITGGDDASSFVVNSHTGAFDLAFASPPNFEARADHNGDNVYEVQVTANDGKGGTTSQLIEVTVTDADEAPVADAGGPYEIHEGGSLVLDGSNSHATDAGDAITQYSWRILRSGQPDIIVNSPDAITTLTWPQLESLGITDDGLYEVSLNVLSHHGSSTSGTSQRDFTVDAQPPTISITSPSTSNLHETYTLSISTTDPGDDTLTSFYVNWGDGSPIEQFAAGPRQSVSLDGTYSTNTQRDHVFLSPGEHTVEVYGIDEDVAAGDLDGDGIADAAYTASLGVSVQAVAPTFSPPSDVSVAENATFVCILDGSDDRTASADLQYSLSGDDASAFVVNSHTGAFDLSFASPPDFEHPTDASGDGVYDVDVTVTDGDGASTTKSVHVTVTPVDEAPVAVIAGGDRTQVASQDVVIDASQSFDPDAGQTSGLTYSLTVTSVGSLTPAFSSPPTPSTTLVIPANTLTPGSYTFTVTATDAAGNTGSDSRALTLTATTPTVVDTSTDVDGDGTPDIHLIAGHELGHNLGMSHDASGNLIITDDQSPAPFVVPLTPGEKIFVTGGDGDDTLTIDADLLDSGEWVFDFDGGDGNDALAIKGSRQDSAIYTPSDSNRGSGIIKTYFENGDIPNDEITFSDIEPVDISGMSTVTIASPANAANSLQLAAGFDYATGTIPAIVVSGDTGLGMTGIEEAHVWDVTNLIVDTSATMGGANTITVVSAIGTAPDITNITLKTTNDTFGGVVFNADLTPSGTVTINSPAMRLNADVVTAGKDASAVTRFFVGDFGSGKIQDAIDLANPDATVEMIEVGTGTYNESLNVNKDVSIEGNGTAVTHVNVGGAAVGVEVANGHTATVSGISVENLSSFGIGIDVKGTLHLSDTDVASGGLIGINVDASSGNTGHMDMTSSRVLGANLFGIQVGGSPSANAQLDLSEVAGATVAIIISNGAIAVTNSKLSGAQRGLVLTSAGTASITGSDLSGVVGKAVTNAASGVINASGNWWGSNNENTVLAETDGPTGSVDITPFLDSGTDGNGAATGFVGDLSHVDVTTKGGQTGGVGRVQEGVNVVFVGGIVDVRSGTYHEDVNANKTVRLLGQDHNTTVLSGAIGGDSSTIHVLANNVEIAGFKITRDGNTVAQWNDPNLNSAGVAVQGTAISGMLVHDNIITGNRTGIDVNNSNGHTIRNNEIIDNRTGMIMRNQTDNLLVTENDIANNTTVGILFLDGSGGTNSPVQTAANSTFSNNNLSGNWYGQIVDRQSGGSLLAPGTNVKNFSGNWFGTNAPVITTANSTEPGYAAQIPPFAGGSATAPGGQPDVAGPASANFDITPYLDLGTDTNVETTPGRGTFGFQGNFSTLHVIATQAQSGLTGRVQEGIDDLASGGTLLIHAGSYTGGADASAKAVNLVPGTSTGTSPAQVVLSGNLVLNGDDSLALELNGTDAPTQYDNFVVTGTVSLGGALVVTRGFDPFPGDEFILINNDDTDAVTGAFNTLPEGSVITLGGIPFTLSYQGSDGNDVTLTIEQPNTVWVNDDWTGTSVGTDADTGSTSDGTSFGYDQFATIQDAIDAVSVGGTVHVLAGTYAENIFVDKSISLLGANAGANPTNGGARDPESIITALDSNTELDLALVHVLASGVTVDGFTIDGHNASRTSNTDPINGVDVGAIMGVANIDENGDPQNFQNISVQNNIVQNFEFFGAYFDSDVGGSSTGNTIADNLFDNISDDTILGDGILLADNFYGSVTGNEMTNVADGIAINHYGDVGTGTISVTNNQVQSSDVGIYLLDAYAGGGQVSITGNTMSTVSGSTTNRGLALLGVTAGANVTISGNDVSGAHAGVFLFDSPGGVTVSGGTLSGNDYGVLASNYDARTGNAASYSSSTGTLDNVTITSSTIAGVAVVDDPLGANSVDLTIQNDTDISGGPTGILVSGANASATITGNTGSIHGNTYGIDVDGGSATITGNHIYDNSTAGIRFTNGGSGTVGGAALADGNNFDDGTAGDGLDDNATDILVTSSAGTVTDAGNNSFAGDTFFIDNESAQPIDATGDSFDETGSDANFRIEDKMFHKVDDLSKGLVTWVADNVYVTAPAVGSTDSSIQRGIDAAGPDSFTVNVEAGTYTENMTINKDVDVIGAVDGGGNAATNIQASNSNPIFDISGSGYGGDATVSIENINLDGLAGTGAYGIRVVPTADFQTLVVDNGSFTGFTYDGVEIQGNGTTGLSVHDVQLSNLSFSNNGFDTSTGGTGDIDFFMYNGDATLTNITETGAHVGGPLAGGRIGIQFRGVGLGSGAGVLPMGDVSLNNVDISGTYGTAFVTFQRYSDATNLSMSGVKLGGATSSITGSITGVFGDLLRFDAVGTGTVASPATVDLGDTHFRGLSGASPVQSYLEFAPDNGFAFLVADATDTIWDLSTGTNIAASALILDEAFEAEDRILDYVENTGGPAFKGWAELQNGKAFVTASTPILGADLISRGAEVVDLGGTVHVADGTYVQQVAITRDVTVEGESEAGTIVKANASLPSPITISGVPRYPVIYAMNTANAIITNLTVDGDSQGNAYADGFQGVAFYEAGGTLDNVTIKNIQNSPFNGVQNGVGVYASVNAGARNLVVSNADIFDFQKNAMALNGSALTVDVHDNNVTGKGATGLIAQNGIQLSNGATGSIHDNTVSDIAYTGANTAVGILLFGTSGIVDVANNHINDSAAGVYAFNANATIHGNIVVGRTDSVDDYGIVAQGTSVDSIYGNNTITNASWAIGVYDGAKAKIEGNTLTGATNNVGIDVGGDGVVDAGSDVSDGDPTGLGNSTGGNDLSGYAGGTGIDANYAIQDLNEDVPNDVDVYARNNNFGTAVPSSIENVVFHTVDAAQYTKVFFTPAVGTPAPAVVYVNDDWAGTGMGTDPDTGYADGNQFGTDAFATIQDAINAVSDGATIYVLNGTYDEAVVVNKDVTLQHLDTMAEPTDPNGATEAKVTRTSGTNSAVIEVTHDGVTIDGFHVVINRPNSTVGIGASNTASATFLGGAFDGLTISNNTITTAGDGGSVVTPYLGAAVSGIALVGDGTPIESVTLQGNTVDLTTSGTGFQRRAVWLREVQANVSGNDLKGVANDLIVQFASSQSGTGITTIDGNTFRSGGVDLTENNSTGEIHLTNNQFLITTPTSSQSLVLKHDVAAPILVQGNTFSGHAIGISMGTSAGVTFDNNQFTPGAFANTADIVLDTGNFTGGTPAAPFVPVAATITNNSFNGLAGPGNHVALAFFNDNPGAATPDFGAVTIGGAGQENTFHSDEDTYIYLDPGTLGGAAVAANFDASQNKYGVTSGTPGIYTPAGMTLDQLYEVEDKIVDYLDNGVSGYVNIKSGYVFVTQLSETTTAGAIQRGVDVAQSGDNVDVQAGTFVDNITIPTSVKIIGAGQGLTIVEPGISAVMPLVTATSLPAGSSNVFLIQASDVEISNLTIDGDNPTLNSGIVVGGADIDARNGIIEDFNSGVFNNTYIHDVTVENIYLRGIYASSGGTGFKIDDNTVDNVQGSDQSIAIFNFGGAGEIADNQVSNSADAIATNWSRGTDIHNNTITSSGSGVHSDNNGGSGGVADSIHNNDVSLGTAGAYGIFVFVPYLNLSVANNTISGVDVGLAAFGGQGGSANFSGNTVSVNAGGTGAFVTTDTLGFGQMNVTASFSGDSFTGGDTGILVQQNAGATANASISGVTINDPTIGIQVDGGTATIDGNHIFNNTLGIDLTNSASATISNNNFAGGVDPNNDTDLQVELGATVVGGALTNNAFAGNSQYISWQTTQNVDATTSTFGGSLVDTVAEGFAAEDKIYHALDDLSSGLVRVQDNNIFVTTNTLGIQRGVDVASSGDTVNVETGTYVENVTIDKALTLDGEGTGPNVTLKSAVSGSTLVNVTSTTATDNVTIQDFAFEGVNGAHVADLGVNVPSSATFGTLTVDRSSFDGLHFNGIQVLGDTTTGISAHNVVITNSDFTNNGYNNGGAGDIDLFTYNGDATLQNLTLSNNGALSSQFGIQLRGVGDGNGNGLLAMGSVLLDNITITGSYKTQYVGIQRFSDVTNLILQDVKLGDATSKLTGGFGAALRFDEVGQGSVGSPATVDLGNTDFRGFNASSPLKTEIEFAPDNNYAFLQADATGTSWNLGGIEYAASTLTPDQAFAVENSILDYVDPDNGGQPYKGWALLQTGKAFVTADVPTFVDSISRGIQMVAAGDTVYASAGTYNEDVDVTKSVTLRGAQFGNDPGATGWGAAPTSIIMGAGVNAPVTIESGVNNVTIDGFDITSPAGGSGSLNAGIWTNGSTGVTIQNDVLENNTSGVAVGDSAVAIQHNLIQNNNAPGAGSGNGVEFFASTSQTSSVNDNHFTGNNNADVLLAAGGPISNVTISGNAMTSSAGIALFQADNILIDANTASSMPFGALYVGGGDTNIEVSRNDFSNNTGEAAIQVSDAFSVGPNSGIDIHNNFLDSNAYGVLVDSGALTGTMTVNDNHIAGNTTAGVQNDSAGTVDATRNWWGDASGPDPVGSGDAIVGSNVIVSPWLTSGVDADVPQPGFQPSAGLGIDISGASSTNEGSTYTLSLNPSNPNQPSITSWDINWGDGSPVETVSGDPATVAHVYADGENDYTISATAHTTSGDATSNDVDVHVNNVAPTIAISGNASVDEGSTYSLTLGAVTDPGQDTVTSYVVHWGDGDSDTYTSNGIKTHTYVDGPNNYNITVDLVDDDGTFMDAANPLSVTVNNVAPNIAISGASNVNEGATYSLTLGAVTDPGQDTVTSYLVHWGDGDTDTYTSNGVQTHTYADGPNNYNITVDLVDDDGTFANASTPLSVAVTVDNVAPTMSLLGPSSANQGETKHYTFMTSDPGVDTFSIIAGYPSGGAYGTVSNFTFNAVDGSGSFDVTFNGPPGSSTTTVSIQDQDSDGAPSNVASIVVNLSNTLQVVPGSFAVTDSGFSVQFNRAIDLSSLNLYDFVNPLNPLDTFHAPDVVVHAVTANTDIAGSVVWNGATNTLTWVKTGAVLSSDNYMVTLVSGSDAFKDTFGNTLDGNSDFTAGDNYTQSFNVNVVGGTPIVSLPDFARGPGQGVDLTANNTLDVTLPVRATGVNVQGVDFKLVYDTTLLTINPAQVTAALANWTVFASQTVVGNIATLTVAASANLPSAAFSGTANVVNITATVPTTAPYGASQVLRLTNSEVNEINAQNDFAIEKVVFPGDANGSGILPGSSPPSAYTAEDASLIGRVVVGANGSTGFDATPLVDPAIVGDASGNGTLSAFDASLILQEAAGINTPETPDETAPGTGGSAAFDPALSIPDSIDAVAGHNVVVPVNVTVEPSAPAGFFSSTYTVNFDPAQLDFVSAANGNDFPSSAWSQTANVISPGIVQVATNSFTTTSGNNGGNPMQLSQLTFAVHNAATLGSSPLSIAPVDPNEDGLSWSNNPADDGSLSITRLVGDYNFDGTVDAADYVIWRKKNGSSVPPFTSADGNGDGNVNGVDYTLWRSHFGDTAPGSGAGSSLETASYHAAASGNSVAAVSSPSTTIAIASFSDFVPAKVSADYSSVDSALELHQTAKPAAAVDHVAGTSPIAALDRQSVRDRALIGLVESMEDLRTSTSGANLRSTQLGVLASDFAKSGDSESSYDFADHLQTDAQNDLARDSHDEPDCDGDAGAIDQLFAELDGFSGKGRLRV